MFVEHIFTKKLQFIILLIITVELSAQNINIHTKEENIVINKDTSFTRNVSVLLKKSDDFIIYPVFYDSELEEMTDIKVYIKKGNRYKSLRNPIVREEDVDVDYINSKKIKTIYIPPDVEAKLTYTVECSELMYFADLKFFSYDVVDTLKYQISVPEEFHFEYDVNYKDSLNYFSIDSIKSHGLTKWHIKVVPIKVEPNLLVYFGIYKNLKAPFIRTIIVPEAYENKEKEYMNYWYLDNAKTRKGLGSTAINKIDELTIGITDPVNIVDILYNYVKTKFKYVAIEIGMGAFVPSHANEVFINKQGDCKDLSNFLSEALNYKGIKSHVALAATYNHISDCNFPSLGSANHVICVSYINDKQIILDPTDPIHVPETPVQSLQERTIFIIKPDGGEFHKINAYSPQQNEINYIIDLKVDSGSMLLEGDFKAKYNGISGNFLKREFIYSDNDEINTKSKKYYEFVFDNHTLSSFSIKNDLNIIDVESNISVAGKIFNDNDSRFLFIDFLPNIIETQERETLLEGTYIGNTIYKNVKLRITMDKSFESFAPIEHAFSNKGISFNLKITNPYDYVIECKYEFIFDYISIDKANLDITNEMLKLFNKIINDPIILKNKS